MKTLNAIAAAVATMTCAIALSAPCAYASNIQDVSDGMQYLSGDITGDGYKDLIAAVSYTNDYGVRYGLNICVNDKQFRDYEDSGARYLDAYVLNFDNGKSALYLNWMRGSRYSDPHGLFTFPGGDTMRQEVNLSKLYPGGTSDASSVSVSGNTATATVSVRGYSSGDPAHSDFDYSVKFKWSGDRLVRASNTCKVLDPQWTAPRYRSYKIYKTPGSKKLVTTVKKGAMAKPIKIRFVGKKVYMQVKTKAGKVGWYRA